MHDFDALLQLVLEQARALHLPVSCHLDSHVQINRRALTRFGCCVYQHKGYQIQLSSRLLTTQEWACRQTLAHEVLHTCPGCRNHGLLWQKYAEKMNEAYGYQISRTATPASMGLPDDIPARHLLVCQRCGREFPRHRASSLTEHPERYRCKCGGTLTLNF